MEHVTSPINQGCQKKGTVICSAMQAWANARRKWIVIVHRRLPWFYPQCVQMFGKTFVYGPYLREIEVQWLASFRLMVGEVGAGSETRWWEERLAHQQHPCKLRRRPCCNRNKTARVWLARPCCSLSVATVVPSSRP